MSPAWWVGQPLPPRLHDKSQSVVIAVRRLVMCIVDDNRRVSDKNQLKQLFIHSFIHSAVGARAAFCWMFDLWCRWRNANKNLLEPLSRVWEAPRPCSFSRLMTLVPVAASPADVIFRFTFSWVCSRICRFGTLSLDNLSWSFGHRADSFVKKDGKAEIIRGEICNYNDGDDGARHHQEYFYEPVKALNWSALTQRAIRRRIAQSYWVIALITHVR